MRHLVPDSQAVLSPWAQGPLQALAFPYGLAVKVRTWLYRRGWLARRRLPCRVVSVGNLTVGGTGKTPVVIWLARWLLARGRRVGVLSRGYGRQGRVARVLVSDGRRILVEPGAAGDEPYLIASRCPGAVVAVGSDRYRLGRWVLERFPIDCFLLDDGFQHLALHRDVDLLLMDASDPGGLQGLLPAGRLREPLSAAARATAVLVTRVGSPGESHGMAAQVKAAAGLEIRPIPIRFTVEGFGDLLSGRVWEAGQVSGQPALVFSGIANPASFRTLLGHAGITVVEELVFPDHHAYTLADLREIEHRASVRGVEVMVTTEKDAGKLIPLLGSKEQRRRILALRIETEVMEGRERLEELVLGDKGGETLLANG